MVDPIKLFCALCLLMILPAAGKFIAEEHLSIPASEIIAKIEKGEVVNYTNVIVEGDLNFNEIDLQTISSPIKFTDSEIHGAVNFNNTIMNNSVNFERTKLSGPSSFFGTRFNGDVGFGKSQFNRSALFRNAQFNGAANFKETLFEGPAFFWRSQFKGETVFQNSEFKGATRFWTVHFGTEQANFDGSVFNGPASFWNSEFIGEADFVGAKFYEFADFTETKFDAVNFIGARFEKELNFDNVRFSYVVVNWASIQDRLIPNGPIYLALIKNFKEKEQFDDADNCYYQYRDWKRQERPYDWDKLFDYISWISCGYGVRWQHTILSGVVIAILFGIYFESYCLGRKAANFLHKQELKNPCKYDFIQNFKKSMSFSVMLLLSLPPEWSQSGRDEFAKFVTHHWFSSILERLIGWGLVLLLIGTLTRLMVRY